MVRQYDALIQNLKELSEVAGQLGGAAGEYLLDDCSAMVSVLVLACREIACNQFKCVLAIAVSDIHNCLLPQSLVGFLQATIPMYVLTFALQ